MSSQSRASPSFVTEDLSSDYLAFQQKPMDSPSDRNALNNSAGFTRAPTQGRKALQAPI